MHYQIDKKDKKEKKEGGPDGGVERKTYSYSHAQPSFWPYQLHLLSGTIASGGTDFFMYVM